MPRPAASVLRPAGAVIRPAGALLRSASASCRRRALVCACACVLPAPAHALFVVINAVPVEERGVAACLGPDAVSRRATAGPAPRWTVRGPRPAGRCAVLAPLDVARPSFADGLPAPPRAPSRAINAVPVETRSVAACFGADAVSRRATAGPAPRLPAHGAAPRRPVDAGAHPLRRDKRRSCRGTRCRSMFRHGCRFSPPRSRARRPAAGLAAPQPGPPPRSRARRPTAGPAAPQPGPRPAAGPAPR